VLPDSAVIAAAQADPKDEKALLALPVFSGRATRRLAGQWLEALDRARTAPEGDLPASSPPGDGPPPAHRWADRDPAAAKRLAAARAAVAAIAEEHNLPAENLIVPDSVRRLAWVPPETVDAESVSAALTATGARRWQVELTAGPLAEALNAD
jgi:ribonuclease D